jgi:AcrR family transcriptional regulator
MVKSKTISKARTTKKKVNGHSRAKTHEDTRALLINTAKMLFADKGYEATTVKDICQEANVNISLVSYHFDGKEGLYRACFEEFAHTRLASAQRLLKNPASKEEFRVRFQMFVEDLIQGFVEEPDLSLIVIREISKKETIVKDIVTEKFVGFFKALVEFIENAKANGVVKQSAGPGITSLFIFGGISQFLAIIEIAKDLGFETIENPDMRKALVENIMQHFVEGLLN